MTKLYAYLIVIALVFGGTWAGVEYVSNLQSSVEKLKKSNKELSDAIAVQNEAVKKLKSDADERLAKAAADLAEAKKQSAQKTTQATIIYKTKPADPNDLCASALTLMNGAQK
jgi:cell division protein FtsB